MNTIEKIHRENTNSDIPEFDIGDTLRIQMSIEEGGKRRLQPLQGTVISRKGGGVSETATLRRVSYGYGIEHIIPLHSPNVSKIEVLRRGHVRRGKLYYLRNRQGRAARVREA